MASEADRLQPGSVVAEYRISRRIGGGGMGTVYAAEHGQTGERVAIKVLRHDLAHDQASVARFDREARAANQISHPAIVDVFAHGTLDDGTPYLVMAMLEGRSLGEQVAETGRLIPVDAWSIAREIADALAAAHARGVIHRDLKPDNVFLERTGANTRRVRLLDLGVAKLLAGSADQLASEGAPMKLTKTGVPLGTPLYMAPEQWWGGEVDARVDQYALGVTLHEMLTGTPPFGAPRFVELAQEHLHKEPPPLSDKGVPASRAIEAFIRRLLEKSPEDRFASMAEVIEAGDAAFTPYGQIDVAARAPPALEAAPARARLLRRFLGVHATLVLFGPVALVLVGYGGAHARDWTDWWKSTGPPLPVILGGYGCGAAAIAWTARRRADGAPLSVLPWLLALATATAAAMGTHLGWQKVDAAVARFRAPQRFEIMHMGMFELTLARFIGFHLAALLLVSMAAATLVRSAVSTRSRLRSSRDPVLAAAFGLGALVAAAAGLPSVALVSGTCAAVTALPWLVAREPAPSREAAIERATASILAGLLALSVGVARVEAREAALWDEQPTRAARAVEIIATDRERALTLLFAGGLVAVLAAIELSRLGAAIRGTPARGLGRRVVALAAVVLSLVGADVALRIQFGRTRLALHDAVESQFALFANLEPPTASGLDASRYAPRDAPALQIARSSVAVDARPIAPLSAVAYAEGRADVGREISRALAGRAAEGRTEARLAVSIDRRVPWRTASHLLEVARRAGALEVELLLTRGPALSLPDGAPPEASWVLGSDFVALPVLLEPGDVEPDASASYEDVVVEIIRRAGRGERPIRLVVSAAP